MPISATPKYDSPRQLRVARGFRGHERKRMIRNIFIALILTGTAGGFANAQTATPAEAVRVVRTSIPDCQVTLEAYDPQKQKVMLLAPMRKWNELEAAKDAERGVLLQGGNPIWIKITVYNRSRELMKIPFGGLTGGDPRIEITDEKHQAVPMTAYGKACVALRAQTMSRGRRDVAPGTKVTKYYLLNQRYDMTLGGTYRVVVTNTVWDSKGPAQISSTPLILHVIELRPVQETPPSFSGF